jgi:large subunit ribosomal protein L21
MYAVIKSGGKQFKVNVGDRLRLEKLPAALGEKVVFSEVLLVSGEKTHFGTPFVKGAQVQGIVVQHNRDKKVIVFKKKRRQGYRRLKGHRQSFTDLFVQEIRDPDGKVVTATTKPVVIDPAKKAERLKKQSSSGTEKKATPKKAMTESSAIPKKKVTKKKSKKAGTKKAKKIVKKK